MGRRRDSHRHHHDLTNEEEMDLLGWVGGQFESDEARRDAWLEHGPRMMEDRGGLPGNRPAAYWDYTLGAPRDEDFPSTEDSLMVDSDALWEARIRWLAERGELRDDELQQLADDVPAKASWTLEAQDRARRRLDAALEGMAARQHEEPA